MSNENNNQFNNEARENHDGQFGHGQKRPYNRPKNYKYKPQHRNSYGRKPMQDRKAPADKEKNGIQVPFKAAIKNSSRRPKKPTSKLKIIPLGGLEQIGMNITAFEYEDSIVVVDCGLAFPEDDMLGIDLVIPDVTYLKENISKVKGFVITHGHEDHIGALPYVLKDVNVPVYSTKLTIALIANKLKEHNMTNTTKLKEVRHGQVINLGDFSIEFIKTNHSIQDASALAIYSPAGIVVHTGDFKVDYTPVFGDAIDLQRFAEIGRKGVLALMCDSTNAERTGFTMSERSVGHVFDNLFNEYKTNRIIIATFASNVDRVQQIINTAYRFGRKVAVEGRSMVNVITTAAELGYLRIPDQTLIEIDQVKNYPDEQVVLITTGSQGESMAALSRMAANIHKKIVIKPNDTIIFSSNPIPGNEKAVSKVINELSMKGAKVIFQDVHVSGHACQEEIKLIYSLVKPKYAIPVHGEYRHLTAQKNVVEELGIPKENIFVLASGNILELDSQSAQVTGTVHTGAILVDGLGVGDVGNIVLRDRQHLAEDGIMIVVVTLERHSNVILAGPDIVSRGFVYVRESMAALSRMAANIHKKIVIKPNDTIIFSSNPIPGNEKAVSKVINELSMKGAKVIFQDVHVSGHACQEEIKLIYSLVKPKYAIPVHGEYRHLTAQKNVVEELGIPKENIFVLASGNILELDSQSAQVTGTVHTGAILVDGLGVGDVGNIVLRDRQHLAEDGIMIVVVTLERHSNVILAGPDIVSRGFVYVRESEDLMDGAREVVENALDSCLERNITDWGKIKTVVKDALSEFLWKRTKRSPMILPIIMEA